MKVCLITKSPPNGMFRVLLDTKYLIRDSIPGKIRRSFLRMPPGNRVKMEVSRYDSTRERIIY